MKDLVRIGRLVKPHGIKGEINASVDVDGVDLSALRCIVVEVEGIPVPFFIDSVRQRSHSSVLLTIDGITDENAAAELCGADYHALAEDLPDEADTEDEDGFYASDLAGYSVVTADGNELGMIDDVEDSTANVLFIVSTPDGGTLYIPVAEEFIDNIDCESKRITMTLPEGMVQLNK